MKEGISRRDFLKNSALALTSLPFINPYQFTQENSTPRFRLTKTNLIGDQIFGVARLPFENYPFLVRGGLDNQNLLEFKPVRWLYDRVDSLVVDPTNPDHLALYTIRRERGREDGELGIWLSDNGGRTVHNIISSIEILTEVEDAKFTSDGKYIFSFDRVIDESQPRIVEFRRGITSTFGRPEDYPRVHTSLKHRGNSLYEGFGTSKENNSYTQFDLELEVDELNTTFTIRTLQLPLEGNNRLIVLAESNSQFDRGNLWLKKFSSEQSRDEILEVEPFSNRLVRRIKVNEGLYNFDSSNPPYSIMGAVYGEESEFAFISIQYHEKGSLGASFGIEYFPYKEAENESSHLLISKNGQLRENESIWIQGILSRGSERFLLITTMPGESPSAFYPRVLYRRITNGINPQDVWQEARLILN